MTISEESFHILSGGKKIVTVLKELRTGRFGCIPFFMRIGRQGKSEAEAVAAPGAADRLGNLRYPIDGEAPCDGRNTEKTEPLPGSDFTLI